METFSRSYLQSMAQEEKMKEVNSMVSVILPDLYTAARNGKTCYFYDMTHMHYVLSPSHTSGRKIVNPRLSTYTIPMDELVVLFHKKFTDCDISYHEDWNQIDTTTRSLRKGILIDWS